MNKMYAVLYPLIWLFMRIFHPWKGVGAENIPEGGVLICGNHTSLGDPLYVVCAMGYKRQTHVMAKEELVRLPVLGWMLRKAGIFGVRRGQADVMAVKEAMRVLRNGERLMMFPEGTRVKEGDVSQIHTGAALFATRTNVPLLPVYISPKKRLFHKTLVVFGTPYYPTFAGKKSTSEDNQRIAEDLMARIRALGEGVA